MQSAKEQAMQVLQTLPDDCTVDDIAYELCLRDRVQQGLNDVEAGRVIPHEEMKRRVAEWLASSGQKRQHDISAKWA